MISKLIGYIVTVLVLSSGCYFMWLSTVNESLEAKVGCILLAVFLLFVSLAASGIVESAGKN